MGKGVQRDEGPWRAGRGETWMTGDRGGGARLDRRGSRELGLLCRWKVGGEGVLR